VYRNDRKYIVTIILGLAIFSLFWPLIRSIGAIVIFAWVCSTLINVGTAVSDSSNNTGSYYDPGNLTYQQLVDYPANCDKKEQQLKELHQLQQNKNFNPDPEQLSDDDRAYNSRLKATIWWYAYGCEK